MSLRRVVKCRFLAHAAVRALGGAGGAGPLYLEQGFEENSSRSSWTSNRCCGDSLARHRLSSAVPIAESYPDPEQETTKFTAETPSTTEVISHMGGDDNPVSSDEPMNSGANQNSVDQASSEIASETSTQGEGVDGEVTCGIGESSVLGNGFENELGSGTQDESTCASTSGDSSVGDARDGGAEDVSRAPDSNQVQAESASPPTTQEAATPSQPHPAPKEFGKIPPGMRIPNNRAEMLRNPFMYESYILEKLSTAGRVKVVEEAMDEGEFVHSSFFGYIFLQPSSLEDLLLGMETMKRHLRTRKDTEKDPDYMMASRFFIPWLVRFNQTDLLFKVLEEPKEYGVVRVQGALTGAVKVWRLAGRIDLLEKAMNLLMDQGDKLNPEFIRATLEAYLNAGMFQKALAFKDKILSKGWRVPLVMDMWLDEVMRGRKWVVTRDFSWQMKRNGTVNLRIGPVRKGLKEFSSKNKGKSKRGGSSSHNTQAKPAATNNSRPKQTSDALDE
ncbi:hypothetical protein BSKO_09575 [Bryopsis sp. KO-2023]|nr:hypothetical protein BSKO_09575 [Bryopsis sp. KO-2023]